ncbi:translocation/assembly module TamB domain-containing protein [Sphingobacterium bovistauri]|uniref:Translocation/assembly module TamB domain-containing protein n=1 Tax=Sphingobacterium bovistauri TaxID=2781959 RepID=A0ABS7Z938_9SPHI|nr:translocation/assembly module TamB domain-containing protein [Sphingobacterium bovistauri]MCA5005469.1 translocation/assembly module TamB domain-containing protein [Sphingobacterium bovistauri]
MNKFTRVAVRIFLWIIGSIIALLLLIVFLIRLPSVQNYIAGKVSNYLETKIGTPVDIGYVNITFPKMLVLENVYFEDQSRDTLVAGEKIKVDIDMFKILKNTIEVQEIQLVGITSKIKRSAPDGNFNFDYIVKAFASEKESTPTATDTASALIFNLDKVGLEKIHFVYTDDMIGTSAAIRLNKLETRVKTFDLADNMTFDLPKIDIDGLSAVIKQWAPITKAKEVNPEDFGITDASANTTSLLPNLGTETILLKNIFIKYEDASSAMKSKFDIKNLSANVEQIDLNKEVVKLKEIILDQSDSYVIFDKLTKVKEKQDTSSTPINWVVSADKIAVDKTNFLFRDDNQSRMKGFDYSNIGIKDLAGAINNIYYSNDSISGDVTNITAKDHSGLYLKQLKGDFVYDNTGAVIENLLVQTPNTTIQDYIKISYPSLDALSKYPQLVNIDARIKKTQIDMKDIKFFAPDLEKMDVMKPLMTRKFYIDGRVVGRLDDLNIPNLEFKTLDKTHIIASAKIKGLPNTDKLNIDLNLKKLTTGKGDLDRLVAKSLLPKDMKIEFPNSISLAGTFKGGLTGFDANMKLITDKGNASVNGFLQMSKRDTTYDAQVSIDNFNLGHLLKQDSVLGIISANAQIKGRGLNPKTMAADVKGTINRFDAMGYAYHDINLDLMAQSGDIAGSVHSTDPNIRFRANLAADMRDTYPKVKMNMMIDSVNLQNLKLIDDNFRYHGKIDADFETADLNHLNGKLHISQSSIAYNDQRYALDTISLIAKADTSRNMLMLRSEFVRAHLVGKYKLTELGASMQDVVRVYYNPNNEPPKQLKYDAQNFEFSATLTHSRFLKDFLPDLERMNNITLDGTFDSQQKSIMAKLLAPRVIYGGIEVDRLGMDIITVDSTLYYSALIDKIKMNQIELKNTVLSGQAIENNLDFGLWIKDKEDKDRYHLGARMGVENGNYLLSLLEDGLMLNYDTWQTSQNNQLSFGKDGIRAHDFVLNNNGQELRIQSQDSTLNAPIDILFNNFRIETLSEILESDTWNVGGGINGTATVSRLDTKPVFVSDLEIKKFYFGQDTVGNVLVNVHNQKENTFSADVQIIENGNDVRLLGEYFAPLQGKPSFKAKLNLSPLKMKTIQAFSMGYLQNSEGDLTGELDITGNLDNPIINGDLIFNKAKINVAMLNADFLMDNQKISFTNQGLQFKQFLLKDGKGNEAKLNGKILTKTYTDFDFNLNLTTNNFAAVNSTRKDNDLFYGKLYVTSNIRIRGDLDKPAIDGNVAANQNTDFVFIVPNDNPGIAERDGVVKFVDKSDTARNNVFAKLDSMTTATRLKGMDLSLNLNTDRDAKFKIIIDEGSQDALNIQGVAELTTTIDASEKITMSGTFTVEDGNYSFNFGPIKKEFDFQKGSTITWNGDPLDARLDITALYKGRFPTLDLVANQLGTEGSNLYKQRIPFDVKLILTGELFKPAIAFDIDLDENNAIVSQDVVSKVNNALVALRDDPAELNKQVFSLIIMGRFMSANPFESLSGGGGVEGIARSSVSSFLTSQLNNLASDLIKGIELDFNLQSEQDYLSGSAQNRTDLNVGISKMLFDDRLKITIGSNFEVEGKTRPGEKPNNIAGDISLDYQLSKDGRYFARVYRKNQYQATLQGQFVETGIGFIINMSYNQFKELFMNERALAAYTDPNNSSFRRRFNVERMETDSVYRDSVRLVIRDSMLKHNPTYRKRIEEQKKKEELNKTPVDSTENDTTTNIKSIKDTAIRNEDEERRSNEM